MNTLSDYDLALSQYVCALNENKNVDKAREELVKSYPENKTETEDLRLYNELFDHILSTIAGSISDTNEAKQAIIKEYTKLDLASKLEDLSVYDSMIDYTLDPDSIMSKPRTEQIEFAREVVNNAAECKNDMIRGSMYAYALRFLIRFNLLTLDLGFTSNLNNIVKSISDRECHLPIMFMYKV